MMTLNNVRAFHLADAFESVARINHYMVGLIDTTVTASELEAARQLLISRQNNGPQQGKRYCTLELALDLLDARYILTPYDVEQCEPGDRGTVGDTF